MPNPTRARAAQEKRPPLDTCLSCNCDRFKVRHVEERRARLFGLIPYRAAYLIIECEACRRQMTRPTGSVKVWIIDPFRDEYGL